MRMAEERWPKIALNYIPWTKRRRHRASVERRSGIETMRDWAIDKDELGNAFIKTIVATQILLF